ncbi:YciI family protein [Variovorax paradoxus]|nr:YciI family protein [Variovorax paradoxus]
MKYLCLVYFDHHLLQTMPKDERAKLDADSMAYDEELAARGQLVVAEALQSVKTAKLVQVRQGRMSQTDGPFIETKEQLGGFILVDVQDLNAAIQVAARIPLAKYGSIEVRPIAKVERIAS